MFYSTKHEIILKEIVMVILKNGLILLYIRSRIGFDQANLINLLYTMPGRGSNQQNKIILLSSMARKIKQSLLNIKQGWERFQSTKCNICVI